MGPPPVGICPSPSASRAATMVGDVGSNGESEASRYLEISGTKLDRPRNTRQIKSFTNELRSFYSHRVLRPVEAGPSKNESGGRRGRDLAPVRRAHTDPHITDLMIVNRGIIGLHRQSQG